MAQDRHRWRKLTVEAMRAVTSIGLVAGAALLLAQPKGVEDKGARGTSGRTARGRFSHRPSAKAIGEGYEVQDLNAKTLGATVASLGVGAAILVGVVFGMIWLFGSWDAQRVADLTSEQVANLAPPPPRLQADPIADLDRARAEEQRKLDSYGWLDSAHTRASIPIARAMALVTGTSLDQAP